MLEGSNRSEASSVGGPSDYSRKRGFPIVSRSSASASPPSGGRPRLVADHTHPQRTLHKDRTGGGLFLFTHLTVEVSVFSPPLPSRSRAT